MRAPLTGIVFALELTHDVNMLLPLLIGCTLAHAFTVLLLKRSILTEKISRRGYHLTREYSIDPLEILFVREVMRTDILAVPADVTPKEVGQRIKSAPNEHYQRLYPVVDNSHHLLGVVTRNNLQDWIESERQHHTGKSLGDLVKSDPIVAHSDEPLRAVVERMAQSGLTRFPVVEDHDGNRTLVGMISLYDLLKGRALNLEAERRRERFLPLHLRFPRATARTETADRS